MKSSLLTASLVAVMAYGCGVPDEGPTAATSRPASAESTGFVSTSDARNFRAHLRGRDEVPPVATQAQGQAIFQLSKDGTHLRFKLIVANIENVVGAHIHRAPVGVNGPIVLPLLGNPFIPDPGVTTNGTLVQGTATSADVTGPLAGDLEALVEAIRSGNTYVNVHTTDFRGGKIRGQIH